MAFGVTLIYLLYCLRKNFIPLSTINEKLLKSVLYLVHPFGIEKSKSVLCVPLLQNLGPRFSEAVLLNHLENFLNPRTSAQSTSVEWASLDGVQPGLRLTAPKGSCVQGTPKSWHVPLLYPQMKGLTTFKMSGPCLLSSSEAGFHFYGEVHSVHSLYLSLDFSNNGKGSHVRAQTIN